MVMELETLPSMVINHLIVWFSLLFFFFSRVVREDNLLPVKSELKWAFDFWLGYKENLRWNS